MPLLITTEQQEFLDSVRRFFEKEASVETLKRMETDVAESARLEQKLKEFGFYELFGSSELSNRYQTLGHVALEVGRALIPVNLIDRLLGAQFVAGRQQRGPAENSEEDRIASGEAPVSVSVAPFGSENAKGTGVSITIYGGGSKFVLVPEGSSSQPFVCSLVNLRKLQEANQGSNLDIFRPVLTYMCPQGSAVQIASSVPILDLRRVLIASELAGICQRLVEKTTEFVKTRFQFGSPVGSFQAVQHRLADMHVHSEAMRALANFAAFTADESRDQLEFAGLTAISYALEWGSWVAESAIQLHGGIGFTWEHELHYYLRRAKTIELLYQLPVADKQKILDGASRMLLQVPDPS